jgi:hypothetical protein
MRALEVLDRVVDTVLKYRPIKKKKKKQKRKAKKS